MGVEKSGCRRPAMPTLRELLADTDVVQAMVEAGGAEAGKDLTLTLNRELAFWRGQGPKLPAGWRTWEGLPADEAERLRQRYRATLEAVRGVGEVRYVAGRKVVEDVRAFCTSCRQMRDDLGQECDRVLAELKE
jgi:hypothetical protein